MSGPTSAAVQRHPHLGAALPEGWVRADLHLHTMWSGDSTTTPDELRCAANETALDVVAITDHNAIDGARRMSDDLACRVVPGEEIRTQLGELIGLFLHERIPGGLAPREVARRIRDQGGVVYVPHPFDPMRARLPEPVLEELAAEGLLDVVEIRNAKTSLEHLNSRAAAFADRHSLLHGAGSDAHVPAAVGAAVVELPDFHDGPGLLDALASARVVGHHCDPPRPWKPRVIPSTSAG